MFFSIAFFGLTRLVGDGGHFGADLAAGVMQIAGIAFGMFASGAISVLLTFGDIKLPGEAVGFSLYTGCIAAIPMLLVCAVTGLNGSGLFPYCLLGTLTGILLSVGGGCIAYMTISFFKKDSKK
jgi:hypothetical protein